MSNHEQHRTHRAGWLRAAVMGANDGIVSTASLVIGVAAAGATAETILLTGLAGTVAGAMSMAAGEYVSVSSQADIESADLEQERRALRDHGEFELQELTELYQARGVEAGLARQVATQLMAHDALSTHAREELGISSITRARPVQAAVSSAMTFTVGAALPVASAMFVPAPDTMAAVAVLSLVVLATLGALAARVGGAPVVRGAARVTFWGAAAMLATALVGRLCGVMV